MKPHGIFAKMFLYTLGILLLTISVTVLVFARQFKSFYENTQIEQLNTVFKSLRYDLEGKSQGEAVRIAANFHEKNQSFDFFIESEDGQILYQTPGVDLIDEAKFNMLILLPQNLYLHSPGIGSSTDFVYEMVNKTLFALVVLLLACVIGALFFAREITNPIRKLAGDTRKMALLEPVPAPSQRRDELGQLTSDVHVMYEQLKQTISSLESEVQREKEMEERQRYFFSAASHELKTPIAAMAAIIEGMMADLGDYKNHPKYLRECSKMLHAQNKIISEMLDIVHLSDNQLRPTAERINLTDLIGSILPQYHTLSEKKRQTIETQDRDAVYCYADKILLSRVISNVIMNAIQNSPERETIRIWSENQGGCIRLCIKNTNAHIAEEAIGKLFEPFYRVDKARSRSANRSGLGLAIVKKCLDTMGVPFTLANSGQDVLFSMDLSNGTG